MMQIPSFAGYDSGNHRIFLEERLGRISCPCARGHVVHHTGYGLEGNCFTNYGMPEIYRCARGAMGTERVIEAGDAKGGERFIGFESGFSKVLGASHS
jgi:hypothetical protein